MRNNARDAWEKDLVIKKPHLEEVIKKLDSLTDDERLEIFGLYCLWCGSTDPGCYCAPHYDD